jgi:hypothetical protein
VDTAFYNSSLNALVNTFSGTFTTDSDIQVFEIDATGNSVNLTAQSFGYGGGTDLTGTNVSVPPSSASGPLGGFATELTLYDASGNFVATFHTFNGCGYAQVNPNTGECLDAVVTATVAAGTYYLALTENDNATNGNNLFSSGTTVDPTAFTEGAALNPVTNFTVVEDGCAVSFCDAFGNQMDGNYDIDIAVQDVVPEPGSFGLVGSVSLLGLFLIRRRRVHLSRE